MDIRLERETQDRLEAHDQEERPRPLARHKLHAEQFTLLRAGPSGHGALSRRVRLAHGRLAVVVVVRPVAGRRRREVLSRRLRAVVRR